MLPDRLFRYCATSFVPNPIFMGWPAPGSCPLAWCSWRRVTAFAGGSRVGQLAIAVMLTLGSSLNGAMVSSISSGHAEPPTHRSV